MKTFSAKKTFLRKKTAAVVVTVLMAISLSACLPNSSSGPPTSDPYMVRLFAALNYDRVGAGRAPLTWSPKLASNAGNWAWIMARDNRLYHQNLGYLLADPQYSVWRTLGENILVGPASMSADAIQASWRNSPPHWGNITNPAFNHVGIGYWRAPDGRIWAAQEFAGT